MFAAAAFGALAQLIGLIAFFWIGRGYDESGWGLIFGLFTTPISFILNRVLAAVMSAAANSFPMAMVVLGAVAAIVLFTVAVPIQTLGLAQWAFGAGALVTVLSYAALRPARSI